MGLTLLEICEDIAGEAGVAVPNTIIGNRDRIARRLLVSMNTAGRVLTEGRIYNAAGVMVGIHNWRDLQTEQVFNTVADQEGYALTGTSSIITNNDFSQIVKDTLWDRTNDRPIRVVDSQEWQKYVSGIVNLGINKIALVRGGQLNFHTTPTSVDTYSFEYTSKNFILDADGVVTRNRFNRDTDTIRLDDHLLFLGAKWRFKESMGFPYAEDKIDYLESVHAAAGAEKAMGTEYTNMDRDFMPNIPDIDFGATV